MKSGSKFLWFTVSDILLHIAQFLTHTSFSLMFFYILAYLHFSFSQFSTCLLLWAKGLDLPRFILSPSLLFISILYAIPFLKLWCLAVSLLPFSIPSLEALSSPQRSGASHSISSHLVMQHEGHHPGFVVLTHWSSLPWHTETEVCGRQKVVDSMFRISFPWQMWSSAKVISVGRIDPCLLQILNPKVTLSFGRISRLMQNYFEGRRIYNMNSPCAVHLSLAVKDHFSFYPLTPLFNNSFFLCSVTKERRKHRYFQVDKIPCNSNGKYKMLQVLELYPCLVVFFAIMYC